MTTNGLCSFGKWHIAIQTNRALETFSTSHLFLCKKICNCTNLPFYQNNRLCRKGKQFLKIRMIKELWENEIQRRRMRIKHTLPLKTPLKRLGYRNIGGKTVILAPKKI
jgi:hypothetical protein